MAGTVVITEETFGSMKKVQFAWTSDASGDADAISTEGYNGALERFVTIPDAVDVPTVNYDIVINDLDSADVLMGGGANRSATVTEQVLASSLGVVANDTLGIVVSNAGNAKKGKAIVYIR